METYNLYQTLVGLWSCPLLGYVDVCLCLFFAVTVAGMLGYIKGLCGNPSLYKLDALCSVLFPGFVNSVTFLNSVVSPLLSPLFLAFSSINDFLKRAICNHK